MATREERFWAKVDKDGPGGCWEWTGTRTKGYGKFQAESRRTVSAHRFAYELLVGVIPDGLTLDHLCRNRSCVNPEHLEPVTIGENVRRGYGFSGINARKTHCPEGHPLVPENLASSTKGWRACMTCKREQQRAARRQQRQRREAA
jgi:hypothetical protein